MRALLALLAISAVTMTAVAQSRTRTVATAGDAAPGGGVFSPTIDRIVTLYGDLGEEEGCAAEGRDAFLEKRTPDWSAFPYFY